ncbi:WD REPEAT-CONTAINING PROTEIN RUP1 [Salix viminalis]|uniref:WD REPEAT-CONTAINING PROTEIN RUP1 n=1 Tax=Salix viminalis TaxID=40686 RepID=A0A9Q0NUC2_SALVM|nr:WD REPEAT-CONTAINING PROTEIN RUP1 [Salix viminalis]
MKNFSTKFHPDSHHHAKESQNQETRKQIKETIEEEEKARCEWDFSLSTIVSSRNNSTASISDALGVIEFDQTNSIVATGGIARKIRIYTLESLLPHESTSQDVHHTVCLDHARAGDYYICTPAKLSSLRWKPGSDGRVLGSGDYDGVVMEYDLERRVPIFERDEHGGRRVWSVDYSHCDPAMGASGSDDGTMQMWDTRSESGECVATVQPSVRRSAVCCVEFNPFGGPIVAIGCADRKVYGYDLRMMADPLFVLDGHRKTVTYIKFLDNVTLVSASIDGCLKLWNSDSSNVTRTYHGHVNNRSFVGLSVWRDGGLFGCGSENNKVFVYDKRWSEPVWVHESSSTGRDGFVSSVCWRQAGEDQCTLVAGGSDGILQVFQGKRKSQTG